MRHIFIIAISLLAISCGNHDKKQEEVIAKKQDSIPPTPVNKSDNMQVDNATVPKTSLLLTPQNISGNLGQVTFSQNDKTVFFYNLKTKKGTVVLNGAPQTLDKFAFDSKTLSYNLSGGTVTINAPNGKFKENKGEDCNYAKFSTVIISMGADTLKVNNVDVQDCPDY